MMPQLVLLGAGIGNWITWIIVIVVVVVGLLNQLFGDAKRKPPGQMPRRPDGGPNPGGGQGALLDEVERFLQESRQQAQNQQRPQQRPPPQQPLPRHLQQHVGGSLPSQQKPQRQQGGKKKNQQGQQRREQQPQRLSQTERARLRPQVDQLEEVRGDELSRLSGQHLQTSRFEERAQHLSHLQQRVETDIGGHVHNVFDHQVGSLASAPSSAATAGASTDAANPALQLIALLGDPNGIRNAILMREILEPPTHRW